LLVGVAQAARLNAIARTETAAFIQASLDVDFDLK
jgi:hypothetical protein